MKRSFTSFLFPCALCLVLGLLLGILLPIDWFGQPSAPAANVPPVSPTGPVTSSSSADPSLPDQSQPEPLDTSDNFTLLNTAFAVDLALRERDYVTLATYVHPDRGVTFTPYSTVDHESDLTFTAAQIRGLAQDLTVYIWGVEDGRGDPIQMTAAQYFDRYVYNKDYAQAPEIGVDRIMTSGNALENLTEAYPGCRFVDLSFPSADPVNDGLDWSSLKLVFQPGSDRWHLVGVVHGEWTI